MENLISSMLLANVEHFEIERDESFEKFDNSIIVKQLKSSPLLIQPTYRHLSPNEEPLLWLADIVAWAIENQPGRLQHLRCRS